MLRVLVLSEKNCFEGLYSMRIGYGSDTDELIGGLGELSKYMAKL